MRGVWLLALFCGCGSDPRPLSTGPLPREVCLSSCPPHPGEPTEPCIAREINCGTINYRVLASDCAPMAEERTRGIAEQMPICRGEGEE